MPVFLDSNVFVFAAGGEHPQKAACLDLLTRVARGELDANTSSEVIQELHHLFRRRGQLARGIELGREVAGLFPGLLPVARADVLRSGDLLAARPQLSPRDALHVATALNNGIDRIVSADPDFDGIDGIVRVDPGAI